jgi:2-polyprenyl-6-methoxyphenol hydroxylase-like FAD-dependent oxidoreductase
LHMGAVWMAVSERGTYLWFNVLEAPTTPEGDYTAQIQLSWLRQNVDDDVPADNEARVELAKRRVDGFAPKLREAIQSVTTDRKVAELRLADWPRCEWPNLGGRAVLVGDAAHAMTMCKCGLLMGDLKADDSGGGRSRRGGESWVG